MEAFYGFYDGDYIVISAPELQALCSERNEILYRLKPDSPTFDKDVERLYEINAYLTYGRLQFAKELQKDTIGYGAKFNAWLPECELSEYICTERQIVPESTFLSMDKATYGTDFFGRTGYDIFNLPGEGGEAMLFGIIDNPVKYYIKGDISANSRFCSMGKADIKKLKQNPAKYRRFFSMTRSQLILLQNEIDFLYSLEPTQHIKNLLTVRKSYIDRGIIDCLPSDETIGFGSLVYLHVVDGKNISKKFVVEYVPRVLSKEPKNCYAEWGSPMGYPLLGLDAGKHFRFYVGSTLYGGKVLGVNNTYASYPEFFDPFGTTEEARQKVLR